MTKLTDRLRGLLLSLEVLRSEHNRQRSSPSRGYDEDAALARMGSTQDDINAELDAIDAAPPEFSRMWINQPSTHDALHHMHGTNVLAAPNGRIYPVAGDIISMQVPNNALSQGWNRHPRRYDPAKLRDTHIVSAQQATYIRAEEATLNIHTIMCIWEALDPYSAIPDTPAQAVRDGVGTAEMRDLCITLSDYVEHVYHLADGDDANMDHIAFDWDFVPWLLTQLDWSSATGSPIVIENMISAEEIAKRAKEAFPRT